VFWASSAKGARARVSRRVRIGSGIKRSVQQ
jgi:hypothetical protein